MVALLGLITLAAATLLLRQEIASVVMPPLRSLFTSETPPLRTKIIQLRNSTAEAMSQAVRAAMREGPGLLVVPHVVTNSLVGKSFSRI